MNSTMQYYINRNNRIGTRTFQLNDNILFQEEYFSRFIFPYLNCKQQLKNDLLWNKKLERKASILFHHHFQGVSFKIVVIIWQMRIYYLHFSTFYSCSHVSCVMRIWIRHFMSKWINTSVFNISGFGVDL